MSAPATAAVPQEERRGFCTPPDLAELIRDLYLEERTGILVLSRSGAEKRVLLDRGMILAIASSLADERLATHMAAHGLIRPEDARSLAALEDRQAAEAMLSRSLLTLDQLTAAIRALAQQALAAVFRWEDLEYRFQQAPIPAWPISTNAVVSFELIIRALGSMAGFDPVKGAMLRQERALSFSDQLYLPFEKLALTPIEGYLVSRIDGSTKPRDILSQAPPSEEEAAARFLFGLLILGLVQFSPPIGPGVLSCRDLLRGDEEKRRREEREQAEIADFYAISGRVDPSALLEVQPDATEEQVRVAYLARKERFEPARFLKSVQTALREELQIIEARLLEAFLALRARSLEASKPKAEAQVVSLNLETLSMRKELSKSENQSVEEEKVRLAGQFVAKARDYFKLGDNFNCIRYCEFAQSHNDNDAELWSLLGQALSRNPDYRWQKRAEAALTRASEIEPFNPGHWVALGEFYRAHKLIAMARKHYLKALDIVPSHAEARRALDDLPDVKG